MGDERGGWKGLDTGQLRDHLHAATAVGRMAGAAKAVELGYGIEADPGPSGRLGGWAISGIPKEAWEVHASRSAQIEDAVGPDASYRSRSIAARATRDRKGHDKVEDLAGRWRAELARAGYPPVDLVNAVERAGLAYQPPALEVLDDLAGQLLEPGGRLAQEKTFTGDDVVVAVAPHLHGLPVSFLDKAIESVLSHDHALALPMVAGAREPVWAAACVVEDERHIAELADVVSERTGPRTERQVAIDAVRHLELERGTRLSPRQSEVATGLLTSGHQVDFVLGVAGSGKTTMLAAVRQGFEAAGYEVLGTATSGQAAKALGEGAGVTSRTVASLRWRLEHGREALTARHVLILDEAGMTSDADVAKLLGAVAASGAKLVAVGDYRQLDAVGPGGALEALSARHPDHVWTLRDNLRQADPAERSALDRLRSGSVPLAVNWYRDHGRAHAAPFQEVAVVLMAKAWANEVSAGRDTLLLAYRRSSVEALNQEARMAWGEMGQLSGPEIEAPGGRRYRSGDRVIALAPGPGGAWATSQRAVVSSVDPASQSLVALTPEGSYLHMGRDDIGADNLGHGYAITAHRSQGATVDVAHVLADGGGRELAYVAMSRARFESHVHVVAQDSRWGHDHLVWAWGQDRRQGWALDREERRVLAELYTERNGLVRSVPPDRAAELNDVRRRQEDANRDAHDLHEGMGRWAYTPAGQAARDLRLAAAGYDEAQKALDQPGLGRWARHKARRQFQEAIVRFDRTVGTWEVTGEPYARRIEADRHDLAVKVDRLEQAQQTRATFFQHNPDITQRVAELDRTIERETEAERRRQWELLVAREQSRSLSRGHHMEHDLGPGLDL